MTTTITAVPFHRLLAVEARKLVDTRTGMILAALLVVGSIVAMAGYAVVRGPDLQATITISGLVLTTLFPVLGILTVTGEWSHRTALTTFALEPRRWRVALAKCVPPIAAAIVACLVAMLAAAAIVAIVAQVQGVPADWELDTSRLLGWLAVNVIEVSIGVALGMALLNAPAAIVLVFASPMIWTMVALVGPAGQAAADWLDRNRTTSTLVAGDLTAPDLAPLAVSLGASIALPLILGVIRVVRKEVR